MILNKIILFFKRVLDKKEKKNLIIIQFVFILSSLIELIGILSILPILAIVQNKNIIFENVYLSFFYNFFKFDSLFNFVLFVCLVSFIIIIFSSFMKIFSLYIQISYGYRNHMLIANKVLSDLLSNNYLFFKFKSNSKFINDLLFQIQRSTNGILIPILDINSKLFVIFFTLIIFIYYYGATAFIIVSSLAFIYFIYIFFIKKYLQKKGKSLSLRRDELISTIMDIINNFKIIKIFQTEKQFKNKFYNINEHIFKIERFNNTVAQIPRLVSEVIFIVGIFIVCLLMLFYEFKITNIGLLIIIFYKLLPIFQQIFSSLSKILANHDSINTVSQIFENSISNMKVKSYYKEKFTFKETIEFKNIDFSYDSTNKIISNFTIKIDKNEKVVFFGKSGSGKTTLSDILMGLIIPANGKIFIDQNQIDFQSYSLLDKKIGYVPQNISLISGTLAQNISFNLDDENINEDLINKSINESGLGDFFKKINKNLDHKIDQDGKNLSGGQIQRIGIARALYRNPSILVLDESTNSLDKNTEIEILNTIKKLNITSVIITHDHKVRDFFDRIVYFN